MKNQQESREEYGLLENIEPPWWARSSQFIQDLFHNPVFQRNYQRSRVRYIVSPMSAFLLAAVYSLAFNIIGVVVNYYYPSPESRLLFGFIIGFTAPLVTVYAMVLVWMFIVCLSNTVAEASADFTRNEINPVFTTPLTDRELYFGKALPNFFRGLGIAERFLYLAVGLALPFLTLNLDAAVRLISADPGMAYFGSLSVLSAMGVTLVCAAAILYGVAGMILMMLLLSLASALYAASVATTGAMLLTLLHYWVVKSVATGIASLLMVALYLILMLAPFLGAPVAVMMMVSREIVKSLLIAGACIITAQAGISSYGRARRDGYAKTGGARPENTGPV